MQFMSNLEAEKRMRNCPTIIKKAPNCSPKIELFWPGALRWSKNGTLWCEDTEADSSAKRVPFLDQ